jgi:hypothetical protein
MKIALIGNMNNNNFAIMRYFRDLGADAHLLLYSNDGRDLLSHFKPECDTWEIEKWRPYIHQTTIPNSIVAVLEFPVSWAFSFRSFIRFKMGKQDAWFPPISRNNIISSYAGYDVYVASGISPATLIRVGYTLDIFYPYSTGVESLGSLSFLGGKSKPTLRTKIIGAINYLIIKRQTAGIRAARYILTSETGITLKALTSIEVKPVLLTIPMVYIEPLVSERLLSKQLMKFISAIENSRFTILHQARLMWNNPGGYSLDEWRNQSKNNDWLLREFSQLIKLRPNLNPLIAIVEYGTDIDLTKQLATQLGVDKNIIWLPKMDRRELMWLLSRATIGSGEFYDVPKMIWGGTGWEALASGKPLLQGFNFNAGEFEQIYGFPPPPMLAVRKQEDILTHLLDMADHPTKREEIGRGGKDWFDRYNGIGLAKKWLDLLMAPRGRSDAKKTSLGKDTHG